MTATLSGDVWLQLSASGPTWNRHVHIARATARRPRSRIPGTWLAHLTLTVPADLFTTELPPAEVSLPAGRVLPPQLTARAEPIWEAAAIARKDTTDDDQP